MAEGQTGEGALVATLNDLLQLDHDAVQAYTLAMALVSDGTYHQTLAGFRDDHERHVRELSQLIRAHGGTPIQLPHLPTGPFKLAMQGLGAAAGDRGVLLAYKTNEGQVRENYRRESEKAWPPDVQPVLARAAHDEQLHYDWVEQELTRLGHGSGTVSGTAQQAVEAVNRRVADAVEGLERGAMRAVEELRRGE